MEAIQRDYSPKGVDFYYVYKALAHPEKDGYIQPFTLKERLMHIAEAEKRIDTGITWICDNMENAMVHAMGMAPNSEFVIDPDGRIVRRRPWSDPKLLRRDLEELVGPITQPTVLTAKDIKTIPAAQVAAKGVVQRIKVPRDLRPIVVKPELKKGAAPFYVKLRADAAPKILLNGEGKGKLYLGFFLDPIYGVHWNNRVDPIRVDIQTPDGITVGRRELKGPKVKAPADIDPREFLIDVSVTTTNKPVQLTVHYFGCNDAEGWCTRITQRYSILLQRDVDSGWPANRMHHKAPLDTPPPTPRGRRPQQNRTNNQQNLLSGTVIEIDLQSRVIKISDQNGKVAQLNAPKTMTFMHDGRRSTLPQLKLGDQVRLQFSPSASGRPTIRRLQARTGR